MLALALGLFGPFSSFHSPLDSGSLSRKSGAILVRSCVVVSNKQSRYSSDLFFARRAHTVNLRRQARHSLGRFRYLLS